MRNTQTDKQLAMKQCLKCNQVKELTEFSENGWLKNGVQRFRAECKFCHKSYYQAYYEANKTKRKAYYEANKEKIKANQQAYREANKEKIKANQQAYYEANKEKIKAYATKYKKERMQTDNLFRLKCRLRMRTNAAFKAQGYSKNTKTQQMLGVEWEVVKAHIERQFKKGMSWSNHGEWHIDHIIPLASAKTEAELIKLCHYRNLQPLWAEENLSKNATIEESQTYLRV